MTGIYLKCDSCGKVLEGHDIPDLGRDVSSPGDAPRLQQWARDLGWTGPLCHGASHPNTEDRCPECAAHGAD